MSISAAQCRAGRALADWSQDDLSEASKVAKTTIAAFEAGKRTPYDRTRADLVAAFAKQGIEFTDGDGVRRAAARDGAAENGDDRSPQLRKTRAPAPSVDLKGTATDAVRATDAAIEQHETSRPPRRRPPSSRSPRDR